MALLATWRISSLLKPDRICHWMRHRGQDIYFARLAVGLPAWSLSISSIPPMSRVRFGRQCSSWTAAFAPAGEWWRWCVNSMFLGIDSSSTNMQYVLFQILAVTWWSPGIALRLVDVAPFNFGRNSVKYHSRLSIAPAKRLIILKGFGILRMSSSRCWTNRYAMIIKIATHRYQRTIESPGAIPSSHLWPSGSLPSNSVYLGWRTNFADLWGATLPHPSGWGLRSRFNGSPLGWNGVWGAFWTGCQDIIYYASPIPSAWIYRATLHNSCWVLYNVLLLPNVGLRFQILSFMRWSIELF